MAPNLSKLKDPLCIAAFGGSAVVLAVYYCSKQYRALRSFPTATAFSKREDSPALLGEKLSTRAVVNLAFFQKLFRILRVLLPSPFCPQLFYMFLVAVSLLGRTYADLWMITHTTRIETGIIERNPEHFMKHLWQYFIATPAISITNNLLKFGLSQLKLSFRVRLTHYLYNQYLDGFTFYKMSNLDNRIANADQLLTQDVEKFCDGIVELYSNLSKPLVDVALYVSRLGGALGFQAPIKLFVYLLASGIFLTYIRRPMGKMTVVEQKLEGQFRFVNSRLIANSEEIAFYQGNKRERQTILRTFEKLVAHLRNLIVFRFSLGFVDNIIAKYCATIVGFWTVSQPFFDRNNKNLNQKSRSELMENYYNSGRMMFKLAEALGRLSLAGREMTRLAGFTERVTQLMNVLDDLQVGWYQRTMISQEKNSTVNLDDEGLTTKSATLTNAQLETPNFSAENGELVIQDNIIRFERVPLVTPNGDVLIASLDLEVRSGVNVLVCGPNGCGKSSLFRILGELWPLFAGRLTKPAKGHLFYIPQRPYMTLGTLRDQLIYPHTEQDMHDMGFCDNQLEQFLDLVQLRYILAREGGWDAVQDWMDVLSGGEKQRIAMARLFYHRPLFAILDECTSAVSVDVEGEMYQYCRRSGITLFTVSHRRSLWIHHEYYLRMDGRGNYEFKPIDDATKEFGT